MFSKITIILKNIVIIYLHIIFLKMHDINKLIKVKYVNLLCLIKFFSEKHKKELKITIHNAIINENIIIFSQVNVSKK